MFAFCECTLGNLSNPIRAANAVHYIYLPQGWLLICTRPQGSLRSSSDLPACLFFSLSKKWREEEEDEKPSQKYICCYRKTHITAAKKAEKRLTIWQAEETLWQVVSRCQTVETAGSPTHTHYTHNVICASSSGLGQSRQTGLPNGHGNTSTLGSLSHSLRFYREGTVSLSSLSLSQSAWQMPHKRHRLNRWLLTAGVAATWKPTKHICVHTRIPCHDKPGRVLCIVRFGRNIK